MESNNKNYFRCESAPQIQLRKNNNLYYISFDSITQKNITQKSQSFNRYNLFRVNIKHQTLFCLFFLYYSNLMLFP